MNNSIELMNKAANNIRILAAAMVEKAKSGHPGGAMGGADFINVLYSEFLEYDPKNMAYEGRDRFFLDPGHMAPMLYAQLCLAGKFTTDELQTLRQWGSPVTGHPELEVRHRGIENTSGPLGQGHCFAVGAAIAAKHLDALLGGGIMDQTIYAYISDGGVQEEISQGAGRIAGTLGLDNLVMFYDSNDIQLSTETSVVSSEDTAAKYRAWGWKVLEINGNDVEQIRGALNIAKATKGQPTLIIGKCIMGKGALKADGTSYERNCKTHGAPLGGDAYVNTIKNLGGDPENPFEVFPEVKKLYLQRRAELRKIMDAKYAKKAAWAEQNPEKAHMLKDWFSGKAPVIDWSKVQQKADDSTRSASAAVLSQLALQVPNMVCASADLSNSDKTDGFLKQTRSITRGDFGGSFFQAGVAELTMACCCLPFVWLPSWSSPSSSSGPTTHSALVRMVQPTSQLSRKLRSASWRNSRPTRAATPCSCFVLPTLTRLPLPGSSLWRTPSAQQVLSSAARTSRPCPLATTTARPTRVLTLASGSEVATLVAGAEMLRADDIKCRIVSVPSEGLFRRQPKAYQNRILPPGKPKFGMTAGLPVTLEGLVGQDGEIWGLSSFGFSAPYKVLDEKLGFTGQNVYNQVKKMLKK